ncbi:MAG: tryptophan synthase subunit alpha [Solirubrobacterales bacterium]
MAETRTATGIERIDAAFGAALKAGRAALMPYAMGGFPEATTSAAVLAAYVEGGADVIELGVPFSDPLADGPVIHSAATAALRSGATLDSVTELAAGVAPSVPVVLMVYANMVLARGPAAFAANLEASGVAGAIVPDLPPEEAAEVRAELGGRGLAFVPLVAPTTPPPRRREICAAAKGFVYLVSDTRTTGEREALPEHLFELVAAAKADAGAPVAVGFGIGTPEQAAEVGAAAEGVIIGSRLVRAVAGADGAAAAAAAVGEFVRATRAVLAAGR